MTTEYTSNNAYWDRPSEVPGAFLKAFQRDWARRTAYGKLKILLWGPPATIAFLPLTMIIEVAAYIFHHWPATYKEEDGDTEGFN